MKIAIIGSAPSSIRLAPYGDPSWQIWGCSPGVYHQIPRCDAFFELHRWEPGVIGKPDTQKPWFSPEYIIWISQQRLVYVGDPDAAAALPNSRMLPWQDLVKKYGHYFFTSTIAWEMALAIEMILETRQQHAAAGTFPDVGDEIGLWGVDMSASEEYGYQRAGCQFFCMLAADKGIKITVPNESDLLMPPPLYGIFETNWRAIKLLARQRELNSRLSGAQSRQSQANHETIFLQGALDDVDYQLKTWQTEGDINGADFKRLFEPVPVATPEGDKGPRDVAAEMSTIAESASESLGDWHPPKTTLLDNVKESASLATAVKERIATPPREVKPKRKTKRKTKK